MPLRDAKLCGCSLRVKFLKGGLVGLEGKRLLGEQGLLVASPVQRDQHQIEQHRITAEEPERFWLQIRRYSWLMFASRSTYQPIFTAERVE